MCTELRCPRCRAVLATDDVNVATDLTLCRACGATTPYSAVVGSSRISPDCLLTPPRWIRVEPSFRGRTIIYRRVSPALLVLIPFTAAWSGFSLCGIYGDQLREGRFDLGQSLFGLPFLLGTVVLLGVIALLWVGQWRITLERGRGSVFVGVGPIGWTRRFTYDRDTLVYLRATDVRVNDRPQQGICVRTGDQELVFGSLLKQEAREFIAASIMKEASEV